MALHNHARQQGSNGLVGHERKRQNAEPHAQDTFVVVEIAEEERADQHADDRAGNHQLQALAIKIRAIVPNREHIRYDEQREKDRCRVRYGNRERHQGCGNRADAAAETGLGYADHHDGYGCRHPEEGWIIRKSQDGAF